MNGTIGDTATVTSTGFTNNATSGASVSSGNNTTTGSSVTVFAGESGTISESFSVGSAGNYTASLNCTGNSTPLVGQHADDQCGRYRDHLHVHQHPQVARR